MPLSSRKYVCPRESAVSSALLETGSPWIVTTMFSSNQSSPDGSTPIEICGSSVANE